MSHGPTHDPYENEPFHLKYPGRAATLLTLVVLGVFLAAVGAQAEHAPKPASASAAAAAGSAAPAGSGAPAASAAPSP